MIESTIKKWVTTLGRSDEFFRRAIIENREEILDLNVAQLEIGENALGNLLDTYTTREYSEFKQALGSKAPFGVADLILEGGFTEGFTLIQEGNEFRFTSTDFKTDMLVRDWGEDIFGLQEKSITIISPSILESFLIQIRNGVL